MGGIRYRIADAADLDLLMKLRLEMLKVVNGLPDDHAYDEAFVTASQAYFASGDQTTVLAFDGEEAIGCATLAWISMMPTFSHPTGKRAHLMNVYTRADHRRQGIAQAMLALLINEARSRGATEISLDATEMGRPLYASAGFKASASAMTMDLPLTQ